MIETVISGTIKNKVQEPGHDMAMNLSYDGFLVRYEW